MIQAGLSQRQVAVTLNRDHRIIYCLWDRYIQTGMTTGRLRSGRPPVTSSRDDQYIVTCALCQRTLNSRRLREQFRAGTNINVSDQTIRNRLNLRARRLVVRQPLTRQHRIARQQWTMVHHRWTRAEWRMVCLVTSPGTTLITMLEERVFGDGLVSDIPHHALHHMKDGVVAQ